MESKYDKVAYPENAYLHSDSEQEEFGTGVYPGVSIISRKYKHEDTIKIACFKVKRKFSRIAIAGVILALLLLIIAIVIISTSQRKGSEEKEMLHNSNNKAYGLFFQPDVGDNPLINFSPQNKYSMNPYIHNLDFHMHDYNGYSYDKDPYMKCKNGETVPEGKVCVQKIETFGSQCTHLGNYGYLQGRPCVLLTLRLRPDDVPENFPKDSKVGKLLNDTWSPNHIGLKCEGETEDDKKHIGPDRWYAPLHNKDHPTMREKPIQNFPETGFNLTYFPQKNPDKYIAPSVMVQFNTIMTNHVIRIKCVAWVANPVQGENPEESEIYTAKFRLLVT
ncbi:sodium/potassium-transporting ATPase subunit beta-like [Saccostrea cucullata]|uniref:sodium/potassium-transporting ATPase subunit beta-like n=1 Tax=Saccostrea cuccullata TaxID=36930 RepID=UPI002ED5B75E